jgi:hypothetical protein
MKESMRKPDTIEEAIRMLVRVQTRLRKEGIGLHLTMQFLPCDPAPKKSSKADAESK